MRTVGELHVYAGSVHADIFDAAVSVEYSQCLDEAPTVTVTLADAGHEFLRGPIVALHASGVPVDLIVYGVWYRLVQLQKQLSQLVLTFEDRAVSVLRTRKKAASFMRGRYTMAEAARALVREVKSPHVEFVAPELTVTRPIASSKDAAKDGGARGFAPHAKINVKGSAATRAQKQNLERILAVGVSVSASRRVLEAAVCAATQESDARNLAGGTGSSVGLFQIIAENVPRGESDRRRDIEWAARWFFDRAKPVAAQNVGMSPAVIAQAVERSAHPDAYARWQEEAMSTVIAYLGDAADASPEQLKREKKTYLYTKAKGNDTWTCLKTWADSVGWRRFVVDNVVYFAADRDLLDAKRRLTISESTDGIDAIDFDCDDGKTVQTANVTCHTDAWTAPVGTPVEVQGLGLANGAWIVKSRSGNFASSTVAVTLTRPQKAKPETAASDLSVHRRDGAVLTTPLGKAYEKAKQIAGKGYVYVYGGGHAVAGVPSRGDGGEGYDCSGLVSAILAAGGWIDKPLDTVALGSFGESGRGAHVTVWVKPYAGETGHCYIDFTMPGQPVERFESRHAGTHIVLSHPGTSNGETTEFHPRHPENF